MSVNSSKESNSSQSSDVIPIEGSGVTETNQVTSSTQQAPEQDSKNGLMGSLTSFMPMVIIFVVFYFFAIRPQDKKRKKHEELISTIKKGEEVITHSGMCGIVSKVSDDNTIEIEIAKGVNIKVLKHSIVDISSRKSSESNNKSK